MKVKGIISVVVVVVVVVLVLTMGWSARDDPSKVIVDGNKDMLKNENVRKVPVIVMPRHR